MEASDLELVRCAGGGDERAFHTLIDRHAPALFRVALSLTRNRQDAEDLMQETFVGAYRGLANFAGRSAVKTWLVQILTRQAAKAWHKSRHNRRTLSIHGKGIDDSREVEGDRGGGEIAVPDAAVAPATTVERKLDVMEILRTLSEPHREILVLREMRGLSYDEIAQVLSVPRGTVESRLSRARAEFRLRYEGRDAAREPGER